MAKTKISEWDSNPNNNTDIDSINIAEGCAPSGINNAIRELMSQVKDFQQGTYSDPFNGPINGTVGATTPSTGAFTTLSASGNVTLSGGTANGVAYLNGSKVMTSGSALTFNGSSMVLNTSTSSDALRITQTGTGNALLVEDSSNPDSSPFVIDAGGQVISGYTTSVITAGSAFPPKIQVHGAGGGASTVAATSWQTGIDVGASLILSRSEGTTIGTQTIVDSGDVLGNIRFAGSDGTNFIEAAKIIAQVDGTPGTNDMPGRLVFYTTADGASSPTERMRIDSSGNLGLGVTPSAWGASYKAIQVGTSGSVAFNPGANISISNNSYNNGTNDIYIQSAGAVRYRQTSSATHVWDVAGNGTAGNAITFTQAMTLNASGNLGIGTSSPGQALEVNGLIWSKRATDSAQFSARNDGGVISIAKDSSTGSSFSEAYSANIYCTGAYPLRFWTNGTERLRIDSSGNLLVGTTIVGANIRLRVAGGGIDVSQPTSIAGGSNTIQDNGSSPNTLRVYNSTDSNNTTNRFLICDAAASVLRAEIRANGGLANYSANNVNLSDARLKRDFTPSQKWLEKLCKIEVGTFFYKDQTDGVPNLGVLAQQVETVAPELVDTSGFGKAPEGEEPYKAIYQTDLQYALLKALQELMAEVNSLKAEIQTLKGN